VFVLLLFRGHRLFWLGSSFGAVHSLERSIALSESLFDWPKIGLSHPERARHHGVACKWNNMSSLSLLSVSDKLDRHARVAKTSHLKIHQQPLDRRPQATQQSSQATTN